MGLRLTLATRQELTKSMASEYAKASKKKKGKLLDDICEKTGWSRDNARRQFKLALHRPLRQYASKQQRASKFSARAKRILVNVWALSGQCCGKYLQAQIADGLLVRLTKHKELKDGAYNKGGLVLEDDKALGEIALMSAASLDRYLKYARQRREPLSKSTTKRTSHPLRNEIPFGKTFKRICTPGYLQADTVAHCGDSLRGDHLWTLNMTDTLIGWSATISIKNRAMKWIVQGHKDILPDFPYPVIAINYDCGSEFINYDVFDYSKFQDYQMTRSRPYHKNDNACIEQRNYDIVRKNAFRFRYEGEDTMRLLNQLWYFVNTRKNFLVPCRKRTGHTTTKSGRTVGIYDKPKTPYRRCMESEAVSQEAKEQLTREFELLNDAYITREINRLQHELLTRIADTSIIEIVNEAVRLAKAA